MIKIRIKEVSENDLKGIGQLIKIPGEGEKITTSESPVHKFYGSQGLMECSEMYEFGICKFRKREQIIDKMEQHLTSAELILALDGDMFYLIAPAVKKNGKDYPDQNKMLALIMHENTGIIVEKGVFHSGLYPIKDGSSVLVGFQKGVAENDVVFTDLEESVTIHLWEIR